MRTATTIAAMSLVALAASTSRGTEVYWVAAHYLMPQDVPADIMAGDLDGDGDPDISMGALAWHYWNAGTPYVPQWHLTSDTPYQGVEECLWRCGTLGDLDQDGDLDLVITCFDEQVRLYRNVGSSHVPEWQCDIDAFDDVAVSEGGVDPYLCDLDNDGDLDLVWARNWDIVEYVENSGSPGDPEWNDRGAILHLGPGMHPAIALADLDGDSDLDLLSVSEDTPLRSWENVGTPATFEYVENSSMLLGVDVYGPMGFGVELSDIDADGDPDLLISTYPDGNFLYLNERATLVRPTSWGRIKALYR